MTDYTNFVTASFATVQYLKKHYDGKLIYVMGTKSLIRELKKNKIRVTTDCMDEDIACVLVSYDNQLTYEKIQDTCQVLSTRKVDYLATIWTTCVLSNSAMCRTAGPSARCWNMR